MRWGVSMLYVSSGLWERSIWYSSPEDGWRRGYARFGIWANRNVRVPILKTFFFPSVNLRYQKNLCCLSLDPVLAVKSVLPKRWKGSKLEFPTMDTDESECIGSRPRDRCYSISLLFCIQKLKGLKGWNRLNPAELVECWPIRVSKGK